MKYPRFASAIVLLAIALGPAGRVLAEAPPKDFPTEDRVSTDLTTDGISVQEVDFKNSSPALFWSKEVKKWMRDTRDKAPRDRLKRKVTVTTKADTKGNWRVLVGEIVYGRPKNSMKQDWTFEELLVEEQTLHGPIVPSSKDLQPVVLRVMAVGDEADGPRWFKRPDDICGVYAVVVVPDSVVMTEQSSLTLAVDYQVLERQETGHLVLRTLRRTAYLEKRGDNWELAKTGRFQRKVTAWKKEVPVAELEKLGNLGSSKLSELYREQPPSK